MMEWNADFFRQSLNQQFLIRFESGEGYALTLVEVTDLGEPGAPGLRRPFSLIFRNPDRQHFLPQHTYPLEHPQSGTLEIFLVPLGPDAQGMRYEAVFG